MQPRQRAWLWGCRTPTKLAVFVPVLAAVVLAAAFYRPSRIDSFPPSRGPATRSPDQHRRSSEAPRVAQVALTPPPGMRFIQLDDGYDFQDVVEQSRKPDGSIPGTGSMVTCARCKHIISMLGCRNHGPIWCFVSCSVCDAVSDRALASTPEPQRPPHNL